jgi:alpha-tubulin suppressor-like RCC1 family protein
MTIDSYGQVFVSGDN